MDESKFKQDFISLLRSRSFDELRQLCIDYQDLHGRINAGKAIDSAIFSLTKEDADTFYREFMSVEEVEKIKDKSIVYMVEMLLRHGCVLGKDFSKSEDGWLISAKARQVILEHYPAASFSKRLDVTDPQMRVIEQELGRPFFNALVGQIETRLLKLTAREAADYFKSTIVCIKGKFPRLDINSFGNWLLQSTLFNSHEDYVKETLGYMAALASDDSKQCACFDWILDVVLAMGGRLHEYPDRPGEKALTIQNCQLLDRVIDFDAGNNCKKSFAEIAVNLGKCS